MYGATHAHMPLQYHLESIRVEMKNFNDAKAPLSMLKIKMQLKADKNQGLAVFKTELDNVTKEQSKFHEKLEYEIAVADAMDPVQACVFVHMYMPPYWANTQEDW